MGKTILLIVALLAAFVSPASGTTWYVDGAVPEPGDGQSWETAFKTIQQGIDAASHGDTVLVAQGTYVVNIKFNGKNITLTSTDALNPDVVAGTIIDGNQSGTVVTFSGTETQSCILSGLTIRNGRGGDGAGICGGELNGNHTHATIRNNRIIGNYADEYGGGLAFCDGVVEGNLISANSAARGSGLYGCHGMIRNNTIEGNGRQPGGIVLYGLGGGLCSCHGTICNNIIVANWAGRGAGLYVCNGTIRNNTITRNSASVAGTRFGLGAGLHSCDGVVQNNLISENSADMNGGGLYGCQGLMQNNLVIGNSAREGAGFHDCRGVIQNNTVVSNRAERGGGLFGCGGTIRNCIVWGNTSLDTGDQVRDSVTPSFCCVEGWTAIGNGNIGDNPLLVDPDGADDDPLTYDDDDFHLQAQSPCIDRGADYYWFAWPQRDLDGNVRLVSGSTDMGCYEFGASPDSDGDLLSDANEHQSGTDPIRDDTDGDGLRDGLELLRGSDPCGTTAPTVISVPDGISSIQKCLCLALPGEEIVVSPGTYLENLVFPGPDVILRSSDPNNPQTIASTILDGGGVGPVVCFVGSETEACVLSGFTIRNGSTADGGGVRGKTWCGPSHATIRDNVISGNKTVSDFGGGGGLAFCDGTIERNTIRANSAEVFGGGIYACHGTIRNNLIGVNSATFGGGLYECDGVIENNTITGNSAASGGGLYECKGASRNNVVIGNSARFSGGGLAFCAGTIQNNTIYGNSSEDDGAGMYACGGSITNCIVWGNKSASGALVFGSAAPIHSCIEGWTGGGEGNIAEDPKFVDAESRNYRLLPSSPCIDAGFNSPELPEFDIAGMHRTMFGGKSLTVDMGAYEYYINKLESGPAVGQAALTWSSLADKTYSIFYSQDLLKWDLADDRVGSAADMTTSWLDDGSRTGVPPLLVPRRFYRVLENP
ncbi:MAG: right-handed parallel beta-helix repeat-containing protein [bacterium]|nr:right-handed parallel beta-helix repeat-containing protein [bacterium]